jgi:hypothetical protein
LWRFTTLLVAAERAKDAYKPQIKYQLDNYNRQLVCFKSTFRRRLMELHLENTPIEVLEPEFRLMYLVEGKDENRHKEGLLRQQFVYYELVAKQVDTQKLLSCNGNKGR